MSINSFWIRFLKSTGRGPESTHKECFHFAMDEKTSNELLQLVLDRKKSATASCFPAFQATNERPPSPGDLNIITDWNGNPRAVVKTVSAIVIPFIDVNQDIVDREGENLSLEEWREVHKKLFIQEAEEIGKYEFTDETPIIFESFELIYSEDGINPRPN